MRVAAGDRWCILDANEDFEFQQLKDQLEFIAPLVFPRQAFFTHIEDHVEWVKAFFENELEQLKEAANKSPKEFVKRTFSGDVERRVFEQAVVTTVTIRNSGIPRFSVRMELSPEWMKARGLWLSN